MIKGYIPFFSRVRARYGLSLISRFVTHFSSLVAGRGYMVSWLRDVVKRHSVTVVMRVYIV